MNNTITINGLDPNNNSYKYTFINQTTNPDIEFFYAQQDNRRIKTEYFNSSINLGSIEVPMCERKPTKNGKKIECASLEQNSMFTLPTQNTLLSRKGDRNMNPLTVNYLKTKLNNIFIKNNIDIDKKAKELKAKYTPTQLGGKGLGDKAMYGGLLLLAISGGLCLGGIPVGCMIIAIAVIIFLVYLMITNPSLFLTFMILKGGSKKRKMRGGALITDLVKFLWGYKNFAFFEIGTIQKFQPSAQEIQLAKDADVKLPKYKINSVVPGYKYFMAVEFVSTSLRNVKNKKLSVFKSVGKTEIRIPYIVKIKEDYIQKMTIDSNNFISKIAYICLSLPPGLRNMAGQKMNEYKKLPEGSSVEEIEGTLNL